MAQSAQDDVLEYQRVWAGQRGIRGYQLPRFASQNHLEGGHPPNWFLGPKAENVDLFLDLVFDAVRSHEVFRLSTHPQDGPAIREQDKLDPEFLKGVDTLRQIFGELLANLRHDTTPYYSWRYQGHMLWDTTLPAMLGYFATMLHNPNNVTIQASTLTTFLEQMVGWDLCGMLGFPFPQRGSKDPTVHVPHGHLTSGGTVANIESAWAAREVRYLPALVYGMLTDIESPLYWYTDDQKRSIRVTRSDGAEVSIMNLDHVMSAGPSVPAPVEPVDRWRLLNIRQDSALSLPRQIHDLGAPRLPGDLAQLRWRIRDVWDMLRGQSVNTLGVDGFYAQFLNKAHMTPVGGPVILGPVTWHYSWPKAMALLGAGDESGVLTVNVDPIGRVDVDDLCLQLNRALAARQPVLQVVVVLGSTEESAVDDLVKVLQVRDRYRELGLEFNVHVDAAWGGYFTSMLRLDYDDPGSNNRSWSDQPFYQDSRIPKGTRPVAPPTTVSLGQTGDVAGDEADPEDALYPVFASEYVIEQLEAIRCADSATIDPHKTGYVPYPAGAITYRNGEIRRLTTFGAPVIGSSETLVSVGEYGVEGSKPGAAAAAVYLSHAVVRPSHSGHGKLMNASLLNTRLFYSGLLGTNQDNADFVTIPLVDVELPNAGAWATDGGRLRQEYEDWLANGGKPSGDWLDKMTKSARKVIDQIHNPEDWPRPDRHYRRLRGVGPDLNIVDWMFNFRLSEGGPVNDNLLLLNRFNRAIYDQLHVPQGEIEDGTLHRDVEIHDIPLYVTKTEIHRATYGDDFVMPFLHRLGVTETGPGRDRVVEILQETDPSVREPDEKELDCYRKLIVMRSVIMDPFLHARAPNGRYYIEEWMRIVTEVVKPIACEYREIAKEFAQGTIPDGDCGD